MSNDKSIDLLLPPGRIVWGDLYEGRDKSMDGRPLTYSNGTPRKDYSFGIAIPKGPEPHWAHSAWGKQVWDFGHAKWPQGQGQRADFAWKIKDGDSTVPTATGRIPRDMPGHAGHWIVGLSSSIAPRLYKLGPNGPIPFDEPNAIMPGDWVEAYINVASNEQLQKPGLYLNHSMVCFRGYDPAGRIQLGPNVTQAGFGAAQVAAGVSVTPTGNALGGTPAVPAGNLPPATAPAPTVATQNPPSYTPPGLAAANTGLPPPPPGAPAQAPVRVMLPKANGIPYEQWLAQGWTDDTLRGNGYMQ
jgi:hypothetical protein